MVSFKKLFGFVFLLTAVLFVSCDLGFSDKKGSVSFEIPFADIVALKNEVSSESENDNETYKTYYTAFVQLKGNGGYYVPKVETVEENQRGNLSFDFYELPEKQTYTIMVDIFSETRYGSHPAGHKLLAYSGQVSDIRVKAGEQKTVDLFAEHPEETASLFDIKVDYLDGDEEKTKTIIVNNPYLDSDDAADSEFYIGY